MGCFCNVGVESKAGNILQYKVQILKDRNRCQYGNRQKMSI